MGLLQHMLLQGQIEGLMRLCMGSSLAQLSPKLDHLKPEWAPLSQELAYLTPLEFLYWPL